jgi:hypothetical protein
MQPPSSSWSSTRVDDPADAPVASRRDHPVNRRAFVCGLTLGTLAAPFAVEAQQSAKGHRIGLLIGSSESFVAPYIAIFRQALRALGYAEGGNIAIEYRYAEGNYERLPVLAADLVRLKVDIIVTEGTPPSRAAKQATTTIPIVMTVTGDPGWRPASLPISLARAAISRGGPSFSRRWRLSDSNFLRKLFPLSAVSLLSGTRPMQSTGL